MKKRPVVNGKKSSRYDKREQGVARQGVLQYTSLLGLEGKGEMLGIVLALVVVLLLLSGFFSGSETAVMASNRYKAQHMASKGHLGAGRLHALQKKPEDMLGMILIGNTFANMLMSALLTWATMLYLGPSWVFAATCVLTLCVLIFAELLPKTLAAYFADSIALRISALLMGLLWLFYPVVWVINSLVNLLLKLFGLKLEKNALQNLSQDELRGLIKSQNIALKHEPGDCQQMLVGVLDLVHMTVNDVMLNRQKMEVIDLSDTEEEIVRVLTQSHRYSHLVVEGSADTVLGVLRSNEAIGLLYQNVFSKARLRKVLDPVHFVPEGTSLQTQLASFQMHQYQIAVVVDEYGDVIGAVNIEDIIEEIIGEFSLHERVTVGKLKRQKDGSYLLSGQLPIRDINRLLGWALPETGPVTLSGWIIEHLSAIPDGQVSYRYQDIIVQVIEIRGNQVHSARLAKVENNAKSIG